MLTYKDKTFCNGEYCLNKNTCIEVPSKIDKAKSKIMDLSISYNRAKERECFHRIPVKG